MTTTNFTAGDNIIDVRDIITKVEELRNQRDNFDESKPVGPDSNITDDEAKELDTLEELLSDLCGNGGDEQWEGDWYPVTLIHENYFEESMDEMLEDIGAIPKDIPSFLTITVDYDALKQDYTTCEFDGETYYYR